MIFFLHYFSQELSITGRTEYKVVMFIIKLEWFSPKTRNSVKYHFFDIAFAVATYAPLNQAPNMQ